MGREIMSQRYAMSTDWLLNEDATKMTLNTALVRESVRRAVAIKLQVEEAAMREALIELGWTPPPALQEQTKSKD